MRDMTHAELVQVARRWLKNYNRCPIVITEMVTRAGETPDAIGWMRSGETIVVECKASRADFLADAKKFFRREPSRGMGCFRYYMATVGLISQHEIPAGWGLLEITAKGVAAPIISHAHECECRWGRHTTAFPERSVAGETSMLVSLIRRLAGPGICGKATVDISPYTMDECGNVVVTDSAARAT